METFDAIFGADGLLAAHIPSFQERINQIQMADAVAQALIGSNSSVGQVARNVLVIEAETGIGKTLAYLIPAVLSGRKVVISTATLTLQDQIVKKDLPLIEKLLNSPVSSLCLKGRQNYLCLYRWYQFQSDSQLPLYENPQIELIRTWLETTNTGDRAELSWLEEKSPIWPKLSTHSSQCLGSDCPESTSCFVNAARKKAGAAQLLVVNHHLFFSDLALKQQGYGDLLPRYEAVIFDEAHHIENVATTFFGKSFSHYQLLDLLAEIEKQAPDDLDGDFVDVLLPNIRGLSQRAENFSNLFPLKNGRFPLQHLVDELTEGAWREEVTLLCMGIENLLERIAPYAQYSDV